MTKSLVVVIDAGMGVLQVIADPLSEQVDKLWTQRIQEGSSVSAPRLWLIEATSVLHKVYKQNLVSEEQAQQALDALLGLNVDLYDANVEASLIKPEIISHHALVYLIQPLPLPATQ